MGEERIVEKFGKKRHFELLCRFLICFAVFGCIGYTYLFSIKQHQRKGSNFRLTAVIHKITLKITHPRQTMLAASE
jgi:hypothetical protein